MEVNDYYSTNKSSTDEEELLLKRLIALKKQLDDDENNDKPKLQRTANNIKENIITSKNVKSSSKFKYCKDNNHTAHKLLSTKIDNRNFTNNQNKIKLKSLFVETNNSSSKVYTKQNVIHSNPVKTVSSKKIPEILTNSQNILKFDSEINAIVKNSFVNNCKIPFNESCYETSAVSQTLRNVDKYMINVQHYLTSSKYVVDKEANSSSAKKTNQSKNVHVNRKFQNQLISTSLLNSNLKNVSNSLASFNKSTSISKKKIIKKLSGKIVGSPNLVKIGKTKLIRQSLFRDKWKINNKLNCFENNTNERKPLSTLQCQTSNTLIPSYKKTEWNEVANTTSVLKSKLSNSSNTYKLKWTRPSILLVNNVSNTHPSVPKTDKLILFGKNKIIRQSLINPTQSKTKSYMLKHLSHRFALMRKLQQKNIVAKIKTVTSSEQVKNNTLSKNTVIKPVETKRNGKRSYSMYSYVNPILTSKTNNTKFDKTGSSDNKLPRLLNITDNKPQQNLKIMNNDKNKIQNLSLSNNKTLQRFRSKKTLTKQLCLVFNRFGVCSKSDQGECDKRHYKKYITLCTKFLTGECFKENCTLSHNIVEEKIPFCKHYLNSVCVQLNCPFLHEYRSNNTPICKNFLHGSCNWGKKCPKKHLDICPIFETKNECPHGQKCLYPHVQFEDKSTVVVEINDPRYFEITIPNNDESNENEYIHIVPKRRAPLLDLPSYIPLKKQ